MTKTWKQRTYCYRLLHPKKVRKQLLRAQASWKEKCHLPKKLKPKLELKTKICKVCGEEKEVSEFRKKIGKSHPLSLGKKLYVYYSYACRKCEAEINNKRGRERKNKLTRAQKDKINAYQRSKHYHKRYSQGLAHHYIRGIIKRDFKMESKDIPEKAIKAKRNLILLKRELKKLQNDKTTECF